MNPQQRARYFKDKSGELEILSNQVISDFPEQLGLLQHLKIVYVFRDPPKYSQSKGGIVQGECLKLSNRERDFYGMDAAIAIAKSVWKELGEKQRYKLMFHELFHLEVYQDEALLPDRDDCNRIRYKLRKHDLNMERFSEEIDLFGFDSSERSKAKKVVKLYRKHVIKKVEAE